MLRAVPVCAVLAAMLAGCQTRPAAPAPTRIADVVGEVAAVEGRGFGGFALEPSATATPPEFALDATTIDQFERALQAALATDPATRDEKIRVPAGWDREVAGYVRRYLGYYDSAGGRRMIVDFYCAEAAANASRTRAAPMDLPQQRGCFARAIYDADAHRIQQLAAR